MGDSTASHGLIATIQVTWGGDECVVTMVMSVQLPWLRGGDECEDTMLCCPTTGNTWEGGSGLVTEALGRWLGLGLRIEGILLVEGV